MDGIVFYLYISGMSERWSFDILEAHKTYCPSGWRWDNPGRPPGTYNLWLVTDGRGTLAVDGTIHALEAGDCFVLRMDEPCVGRHDPAHPLVVPWIVFRVRGGTGDSWRAPALYRRVVRLSFLAELMEHAILEHLQDAGDGDAAEDSLRVALHVLADEDGGLHADGMDRARIKAIRRVCERIRCEPGHAWTVEGLASDCHVSPGHFTRLFKTYARTGPRAFITRTRIEAAKGLLRMSDHAVGDIAALLGYDDIYHFSRQFREKTGVSPSRYRAADVKGCGSTPS